MRTAIALGGIIIQGALADLAMYELLIVVLDLAQIARSAQEVSGVDGL
jgi:hypothetical protein